MKKQLEHCSECNEETWHMMGKKLASKGKTDKHYIKRTTSHCMKCNKRVVINSKQKRSPSYGL